MKTKFRFRHLALYSICRNVSRCAASLTDLASKVAQHAFEVQRFARNRVVLFDDRSGKLMGEVGALVGDLLVLTGQSAPGLSPVRATLLFATKPPPESVAKRSKPTSMPIAVSDSIAGLGKSGRLNSTTSETYHFPVASRLNVALFNGKSTA